MRADRRAVAVAVESIRREELKLWLLEGEANHVRCGTVQSNMLKMDLPKKTLSHPVAVIIWDLPRQYL